MCDFRKIDRKGIKFLIGFKTSNMILILFYVKGYMDFDNCDLIIG